MNIIGLIVVAYLIGSVPFAWIVARRWAGTDLRQTGSRNVGATNVMRVSGIRAGVIVLLLDMLKGASSVLLAERLVGSPVSGALAGLAAIVGHVYPVWLRFRGGKGVATACGVFSVLAPSAAALALTIFAAGVWATRYVSLASLIASVSLPPLAYATGHSAPVVTSSIAAAALIVFRHRSNLARLAAGTEPRIGLRPGVLR